MKDIRIRKDGRVGFRVRIRPSSPKDELLGWNDAGELRVRVRARPVEGAANDRLVKFLAGRLGVPRREVVIETGHLSRVKTVSAPPAVRDILDSFPDE